MKVLVCGGRNYGDRAAVVRRLDDMLIEFGNLDIIQGGADGADALAREWARSCYCTLITEHANWTLYGKAAGPIRNQLMLDKHKPDLVLAFPGGRGTADLIKRADAAGVPVTMAG